MAVFAQTVAKKPHIALNGEDYLTTPGLPEGRPHAYIAVAPDGD